MRWILVATDGSPAAQAGVHQALDLAARLREGIVLIHSIEPPVGAVEGGLPLGDLLAAREASAQALLDAQAEEIRKLGVEVHTRVLVGSAADCVAQAATAPEVEMVVVGSRGRGAVARLFLGSVATRLSHICPKPLLIVRGETAASA